MALKGQVAIVTGSSRGLGKAVAIALAKEGVKVAVVARSEKEGRFPGTIHQTVEAIRSFGGEAVAIACDLTKEQDIERMFGTTLEKWGQVDILVNNAAAVVAGGVQNTRLDHWDLAFGLNVRGPFLCAKLALPRMIARRTGSIINISSGAARSRSPTNIPYAVSKAALERLTICLAEEVRGHNIAVNALNPGGMKTEGVIYYRPKDFDWTGFVAPEEVCPPILFLAQQTAETFTGKIVKAQEFRNTWPEMNSTELK